MGTIRETLAHAVTRLRDSDTARLDAELLLAWALQQSRAWLMAHAEDPLPPGAARSFEAMLQRRCAGEPVAYLLGYRDFWTLRLRTTPMALIPRPDTETLVEQTLQYMPGSTGRLLDLGTGTGAIVLALAAERPGWHCDAVDISPQAVQLARENAATNGIGNVQVWTSDWFADVVARDYTVIVANPPYIADNDPHLDQGDLRFEPPLALVAPEEGFAALEQIILGAPGHLLPGGYLLLEHGYRQAAAVRECLLDNGFKDVFTTVDLAGNDRVSGGCWSKVCE